MTHNHRGTIVTYRPSWRCLRNTLSERREPRDSALPHQKSVPSIMALNCHLRDCHYRSKYRSSYETQCSAANCLNYTVMSKVSFISLIPKVAVPVNNTRVLLQHHCDDSGCDLYMTYYTQDTTLLHQNTLHSGRAKWATDREKWKSLQNEKP